MQHVARPCSVHLTDGYLLLPAGYLACQIADESDEGDEQGHQSAYHHRRAEAVGVGVEFGHHLTIGRDGNVGIVLHQPLHQFVGFLQAFHRVEADVEIVHLVGLAAIVAEAGASVRVGDAANASILIHANDGVRSLERGTDNLLAHGTVPTGDLLHALFKLSAHHHLTQCVSLLRECATGDDGDAHHVEIAVAHVVEVGDVHVLLLAAGQIDVVAALMLRQIGVGHRDALHTRQFAQFLHRQLALLAADTVFQHRAKRRVVVAGIIVDHHPILAPHDGEQYDEERGRGKLQAQQQQFPQTMALAVVLECRRHGHMGIDIAWHQARDKQHDDARCHYQPHVAACGQQHRQGCTYQFLYCVLSQEQQQGCQCQRQQQVDGALAHHLIIYMACRRTIAHVNGHLARPAADATDDEQQIVEHGTADEHDSQQGENPRHAACALVVLMVVAQRTDREPEVNTGFPQLFLRQVFALHLLYLGLQVVGSGALSQSDVGLIAVIAHPVVAPVIHQFCNRGHRHHHLQTMQLRVQGNILINAAHGQCPATPLVIKDLFADNLERIVCPH